MADQIDVGGLRSSLVLDTSQFFSELDAAEARAKSFQSNMGQIGSRLGGSGGGGGGGGGAPGLGNLSNSYSEINRLSIAMRQGAMVAGEFGAPAEKLGLILGSLELRSMGAGIGLAALGLVLAAGVEKSLELGAELDTNAKQLENFGNVGTQQAQRVKDAFVSMAGSFGVNAQDNLKALADVSGQIFAYQQTPVSDKQATSLMQQADAVSKVTGEKLGDVTQSITSTSQAFGVTYAEAANILLATNERTGVSIAKLSDNFDQLHGKLGTAAPSLRDTAVLTESLSRAGFGPQAPTGATGIIGAMMGGGQDTLQQLGRMGISPTDATGQLRSFDQIIPEVISKLSQMDTASRHQAETLLVGQQNWAALDAVVEQGAQGWESATAMVDGSTTALQQHAQAVDSASGAWDRLKASIASHAGSAADTATQAVANAVAPSANRQDIISFLQGKGTIDIPGSQTSVPAGMSAGDTAKFAIAAGLVPTDTLLRYAQQQGYRAPSAASSSFNPADYTTAGTLANHLSQGPPASTQQAWDTNTFLRGPRQEQTDAARATELQTQAALAAVQGNDALSAALTKQAQAFQSGDQWAQQDAAALGSNAQATEQLTLATDALAQKKAELTLQSSLAAAQGQGGVAAALSAEAGVQGPGHSAQERQAAASAVNQAQLSQQIAETSQSRADTITGLQSQALVAAASGESNYAAALLNTASAYQQNDALGIQHATALQSQAQAADQLVQLQNQLRVAQIGGATGALQTGTQMSQTQVSFAAMPPQEQSSMQPWVSGYESALARVQDLQTQLSQTTDGESQKRIQYALNEANATAQYYQAGMAQAQQAILGLGQAMQQVFQQPSGEELGLNVQKAAINLQMAGIVNKYASQGQFVPQGSQDWNTLMQLGRQEMPLESQGGLYAAQRALYSAQTAASMPSFSMNDLGAYAAQNMPQLPNYAALPSQTGSVTAAPGPGVNTISSGGLHVTVQVNGEQIGEAAANTIHDGMAMQVGPAPGGAGGYP